MSCFNYEYRRWNRGFSTICSSNRWCDWTNWTSTTSLRQWSRFRRIFLSVDVVKYPNKTRDYCLDGFSDHWVDYLLEIWREKECLRVIRHARHFQVRNCPKSFLRDWNYWMDVEDNRWYSWIVLLERRRWEMQSRLEESPQPWSRFRRFYRDEFHHMRLQQYYLLSLYL